jgi:regulator of sigma E protease
VRLFGEDETDHKLITSKGSFGSIPVIQRILIVIAGVFMNLLLAVLLFWVVLFSKGFQEKIPLILPFNFAGVTQVNENVILIGSVSDKSPAFYGGINSGDRIIAINSNKLTSADDFINLINKNAGEAVTLTVVDSDDLAHEVTLVPRSNPPQNQGPIGVSLGQITMANISYDTLTQKIFAGFIQSYNYTLYSLQIFGHLLSQSIATKNIGPVAQTVSGPVGITQLANSVLEAKSPLMPYLNLVALLSLNLAIINILPFPALDGGRLLFLLIELVSRKG